jgi:hypothetical protein
MARCLRLTLLELLLLLLFPLLMLLLQLQSSSSSAAEVVESYFSICLALKEDDDVLEWIDYHSRMGCSRFYIFDSNSIPPMNKTLSKHIESGLVTYTYLPAGVYKPHVQYYIYDQCIKRFGQRHTFMVSTAPVIPHQQFQKQTYLSHTSHTSHTLYIPFIHSLYTPPLYTLGICGCRRVHRARGKKHFYS